MSNKDVFRHKKAEMESSLIDTLQQEGEWTKKGVRCKEGWWEKYCKMPTVKFSLMRNDD